MSAGSSLSSTSTGSPWHVHNSTTARRSLTSTARQLAPCSSHRTSASMVIAGRNGDANQPAAGAAWAAATAGLSRAQAAIRLESWITVPSSVTSTGTHC
jgi:hypothetical protein